MVMTSISVVVGWDGSLTLTPSTTDIESAASSHVLAFSSHGDLLVAESEGDFDRLIWERVLELAEHACRHGGESYSAKLPKHGQNLEVQLKSTLQDRVKQDESWKHIGP